MSRYTTSGLKCHGRDGNCLMQADRIIIDHRGAARPACGTCCNYYNWAGEPVEPEQVPQELLTRWEAAERAMQRELRKKIKMLEEDLETSRVRERRVAAARSGQGVLL